MLSDVTFPHFPPESAGRPEPVGRRGDGPALVVVGVDGSDPAWRAYSWAVGHARRAHCPVLALFVATSTFVSSVISYGDRDGHIANAFAELAEQLRTQVAAIATEVGVEVRFAWVRGEPAHALIAAARENSADLIVVGAPHHLLHRVVGSRAGRLIRNREIPIVVVP
jgi:nucleotide-binding universal stress UspA family protein